MLRAVAVGLTLFALAANAAGFTLSRDDWAGLRKSATTTPMLGELLAALERERDGMLLVRHPGGDAGARWAEALRDHLVARGLPSNRIALRPGAFEAQELQLEVRAAEALH